MRSGWKLDRVAEIRRQLLDVALIEDLGVAIILSDVIVIVEVRAPHGITVLRSRQQHRNSVAELAAPPAIRAGKLGGEFRRTGRAGHHRAMSGQSLSGSPLIAAVGGSAANATRSAAALVVCRASVASI